MDKSSSTEKDWGGKFDILLDWLDHDRHRAGEKYEEVRQSLIKIFVWRGCSDAEGLADETINRVTRRLPKLAQSYVGDPSLYFYGVAKRVLQEYQKQEASRPTVLGLNTENPALDVIQEEVEDETHERIFDCFNKCLLTLNQEQRELVIQYYAKERGKVDFRKDLADQVGLSLNGLRVYMHRIRSRLSKCIETCMQEKKSVEK